MGAAAKPKIHLFKWHNNWDKIIFQWVILIVQHFIEAPKSISIAIFKRNSYLKQRIVYNGFADGSNQDKCACMFEYGTFFPKTEMKAPTWIDIRASNICSWKQICQTTTTNKWNLVEYDEKEQTSGDVIAGENRIILLWIHMQIRWKTKITILSSFHMWILDFARHVSISIALSKHIRFQTNQYRLPSKHSIPWSVIMEEIEQMCSHLTPSYQSKSTGISCILMNFVQIIFINACFYLFISLRKDVAYFSRTNLSPIYWPVATCIS